ncbi:MAG: L-2-hydroxyglutarate oxidase [Vampirovibrionales bacterium]|nr:L-2-hydroxyglutarate oxidase [Vampirovibrionales bacterium]
MFADFAIVGAGIVGLTIAREIRNRYPDCSIVVFDKEAALASHGSGRNSGVLHSGIYYPEGSLKAKVCAEGARLLRQYCIERHLPLREVGKIILPVNATDYSQLDLLLNRARHNGVEAKRVDADQLRTLEPDAHTLTGSAIFIPNTAVFDPINILQAIASELQQQKVDILTRTPVISINPVQKSLQTPLGSYHYGYLINAAGLHADRLAKPFGVGENYRILPFKGLYYRLSPNSKCDIRHHVYPVPDLRVPFLGVHFTLSHSGTVYVGPTAIPAFGREHYQGLSGLDMVESPSILYRIFQQYLNNQQGFRHFTHQEAFRFLKPNFVKAAQALVPGVTSEDLVASPKVGIRAQLLDTKTLSLVHDFVLEKGEHSLHVLNAVSPAYTSAMSFARLVAEHIEASTVSSCMQSIG